jgi:hypothetical protein
MLLRSLVHEVQAAAEEVASGKKGGHTQLLRAIHSLNLAVETPAETLGRICYQVSLHTNTSRDFGGDTQLKREF